MPRRQPEPRASHLWSLLLPAWLFLRVLLPWDLHATKNENLEAHSKQSSAGRGGGVDLVHQSGVTRQVPPPRR